MIARVASRDTNHPMGNFILTLKANNNQIIGTSEMYSSAEMRDKGVDSAKVNGATVETKT